MEIDLWQSRGVPVNRCARQLGNAFRKQDRLSKAAADDQVALFENIELRNESTLAPCRISDRAKGR